MSATEALPWLRIPYTEDIRIDTAGTAAAVRRNRSLNPKYDQVRLGRSVTGLCALKRCRRPLQGRRKVGQVIDQDRYTHLVAYAPGSYTLTRKDIGTRYVIVFVRTFVDPNDPDDMQQAHVLQDAFRSAAHVRFEERGRSGTVCHRRGDGMGRQSGYYIVRLYRPRAEVLDVVAPVGPSDRASGL